MNIIEYPRPEEFLSMLQKTMSMDSENDFILGLVNLLVTDPGHYKTKPLLAVITEQNQVKLSAFMTPPWPIILYAQSTPTPQVWSFFIEYLKEKHLSISGVNAQENLSDRFAQQWCISNSCKKTIKMTMKFFSLHNVQHITPCSGYLVQADMRYYDLILKWAQQFHREIQLDEDKSYLESHVTFSLQTGNVFLWVDDTPVCMTFRERPYKNGVSIGYVYTPKNLRQQGYATNCVAEVSKRCLEDGYLHCTLFTDERNPISNTIYKKIGYRYVCEYVYYDFISDTPTGR
jgi:predicted GNAT family acetyltransferase